jgi:hypothetical protein
MAQDTGDSKLEKTLRKAIKALLGEGLVASNVSERGGELLELEIVRAKIGAIDENDEDVFEAACCDALTSVLTEAVVKKRIPRGKHRRILRYLLPLRKEFVGTDIHTRRKAAGENMTDGKKTVSAGTIRTYKEYEPAAVIELARALVEMEIAHRRSRLKSTSDAD